MTQTAVPKTKVSRNALFAFLSGGLICAAAEGLVKLFTGFGANWEDAKVYTLVILIGVASILTAVNCFDKIALVCGAGTLVPITGFANAIVAPAMEYKSEGHILGIGAKMFTIAGPVIVFGTLASVLYGLILWIFKLY